MAEDAEKLRHILLTEKGRTERYTNPRAGGGKATPPPRNRQEHGQRLLHQFEAIRQRAQTLGQERASVGLSASEGIYLQFEGEPGHDLAIESLEDTRQGIELLTVQERGGKVFATVYVPDKKINAFVQKIEKYLKENTPRKGLPKHQTLGREYFGSSRSSSGSALDRSSKLTATWRSRHLVGGLATKSSES